MARNAKSASNSRLAGATSPYLQDHASNPVDWYPWGEEALARAREEHKPILLSIGYSACHWCHVMAEESFSDPDTARVMNDHFINIKVDREQRPDLDRIYQTAHQLLTGRGGGWPLTVFLAPDQTPFFAGTYFPAEARHGLPGFRDVLTQISNAWREKADAIEEQNQALRDALERLTYAPTPEGDRTGRALLDAARDHLASEFDERFGGFGSAPKFPQATQLQRLLRHYALTLAEGQADRHALHMACLTLRRMGLGGIYDQVGGGFARYSVDEYWIIPHFEKMLTDNGQLLGVYAEAWHATGDALFKRIARETADWLLREMRHPKGGFFTALDADSEGEEGRFYLWTPDDVRAVLTPEEARLVELRFGLDERANFEGRWHLHVNMTFSELAKRLHMPREDVIAVWSGARRKLLKAREQRTRPARDEKILTGANALTITGLARGGRLMGDSELVDAAEQALAFVGNELWVEGRLKASWRDGTAELGAYLDDYAGLLEALLEQLQARWRGDWLDWAVTLGDQLLARFEDREHGGFYLTADDHEGLIHRPKPYTDDALPSGNGLAALALSRLGHLTGESRFLTAAERTLTSALGSVERVPHAHGALLHGLEESLYPPETVLIHPQEGENASEWQRAVEVGYAPRRQAYIITDGTASVGQLELAGHGAWVCRGTTCGAPSRSPQALAEQLADASG
jgi:uncharacterized protein YyaL (SSP411 family)